MLRSTTKVVCERLHNTLIESAWDDMLEDGINLDDYPVKEQWGMVARAIWDCFVSTHYSKEWDYRQGRFNRFRTWCQGLPNFIPPYYYNWDCKEYVKGLLEESDREADRFTERDAEETMTKLFYREITKAVRA